jgi:murein L,D-transpeptidase YafK
LTTLGVAFVAAVLWRLGPALGPDRAEIALTELGPTLRRELAARGSSLGAPAFVRIFKEPPLLELWTRGEEHFALFRSYPICRYSGKLGPKTREGDRQAPEGFYRVLAEQLNPRSRFHLSFDLGYPNAYELALGFSGNALMVHGSCVSIGCYAMGDAAIREIYTVISEALRAGQDGVWVHAFPFPLTPESLRQRQGSEFVGYWRSLAPAFEAFERTRVPPAIEVTAQGYRLN